MKQCKNCIFYDAEMEALRQSGDDVIIVGHENDEEKIIALHIWKAYR